MMSGKLVGRSVLMLVLVLLVTFRGNAFAACGGGVGSLGWVEGQADSVIKNAMIAGRNLERAAEAMRAAQQSPSTAGGGTLSAVASAPVAPAASTEATASANKSGNGEELLRRAREVVELAKKFEELSAMAMIKLVDIRAKASSAFDARPADMSRDRLESMAEKVKVYKEQALGLLS